MGKKSKRRTAKTNEKTPPSSQNGAGARSLAALSPFGFSSIVVSTLSESSFSNPFENEPTPKTGWARELRLAEKHLKDDKYRNPKVVIRAATAACAMRQFDRLGEIIVKAESKCVPIDGADNLALFREWKDKCSSYTKRSTRLNEPEVQAVLKKAVNEDMSLDSTTMDQVTYSGLTALQYAALQGDVLLLERLVSLGVALDYSHDEAVGGRRDRTKTKKPPGCTALLIAVVGALCCRQCLTFEADPKYREMYEGEIECAVALVRMGANVDVRLHLPVGRDANSETYEMMKLMKWTGKSVRELATETGSELLVQTIKLCSSTKAKIELAHCRCGSRLPWEMCHSGTEDSGCHYDLKGNLEDRDRKVLWRFSPCAPCPCKNSKKTYFKCCWDEPFREYFQDDETSELSVSSTMKINDHNREAMFRMYKMRQSGTLDMMQNMDPNALLKLQCDQIRAGGQYEMEKMAKAFHPKSKLGTWDPNVYAGVMEHMNVNDFFQWNDVHWNLPKPELLKRVGEWNEALEQYCNHAGLVGLEREEVMKLHTASKLAPCANMNCDKMETKVKEFSRCSKCLSIAYCSSACSKEDYPFHKEVCMERLPKYDMEQKD